MKPCDLCKDCHRPRGDPSPAFLDQCQQTRLPALRVIYPDCPKQAVCVEKTGARWEAYPVKGGA